MSPWGWIANVFLVAGLWFVGNRLKWAFLLTIVGEVAWVFIAVARDQYDMAAICAVFTLLALRNLLLWHGHVTLQEIAVRLGRHQGVHHRDASVWKWLTCAGVTGVKGVTPLQQIDAGKGHHVMAWIETNWGAPPDGVTPDPGAIEKAP
jgi:hypothetical protein